MGHNMLFVELVLLAAGLAHAATFPPPLDLPRPPPPARPVQDPQHAPAHLLKVIIGATTSLQFQECSCDCFFFFVTYYILSSAPEKYLLE